MPQLTWVGKIKSKIIITISFPSFKKNTILKLIMAKPENSQNNMLIQGDNLLALKSLLPKY